MAARFGLVALLAASQAAASPFPEAQLVKRYDPGSCNNQSCIVANIAGNTGQPVCTDPSCYPVGDTYNGDCCVITLNPSVAPLAYQFNPQLKNCAPSYDKRSVDGEQMSEGHALMRSFMEEKRAAMTEEEFEEMQGPALEKRACTSKMLIYARGTFEPGTLGITVGPKLQKDLAKYGGWSVTGVPYSSSINGDYCLGLPGGIIGKQTIESVAAACPKSNLFLAGYSQGALVVRNGLGNSTAGSRVKGILTFGDPFEGAQIKGYNGPIQVYCNKGDGVCMGQLDITVAHLSYNAATVAAGAALLQQMSLQA